VYFQLCLVTLRGCLLALDLHCRPRIRALRFQAAINEQRTLNPPYATTIGSGFVTCFQDIESSRCLIDLDLENSANACSVLKGKKRWLDNIDNSLSDNFLSMNPVAL
jgi:hypothetical protein